MPVFVCDCHFRYDLFNILISSFDSPIHLQPVRRRVLMQNLELFTEFGDHYIVEICTIFCDDSFRDTIPTNQVMLDKLRHNVLGSSSNRADSTHFVK